MIEQARPRPTPREPVQWANEDWISFSYRWEASSYGERRRAEGERLHAVLGPTHAAEKAGKLLTNPY